MKQKVYLSLTDEDLEKLKAIGESGESEDLSSLIKLLTDKEDKNKYIAHQVYLALSDISGFEPEKFNDDSDLKYDLGLSLYHKRALKNYFQNIATALDSDKVGKQRGVALTSLYCENRTINQKSFDPESS